MPATARAHFDDDVSRAWSLHTLALATEPTDRPLALDLGRVSVAFGVGALDSYLCDAFTDTLARCLRSCRQRGRAVPAGYAKLELPIGPLLTDYAVRNNWGLRMASRALMERDNLLQLRRLQKLFNPALPSGQRLWADLAPQFVDLDRVRLTGFRKADYRRLTGKAKSEGPKKVSGAVLAGMGVIVQRRHDVVHNCDRPRSAKQNITLAMAQKMLTDIGDFFVIIDDHLDANRLF